MTGGGVCRSTQKMGGFSSCTRAYPNTNNNTQNYFKKGKGTLEVDMDIALLRADDTSFYYRCIIILLLAKTAAPYLG